MLMGNDQLVLPRVFRGLPFPKAFHQRTQRKESVTAACDHATLSRIRRIPSILVFVQSVDGFGHVLRGH